MNKADERKLFDLLYRPKMPWSVVEDEAPDFRCSVAGNSPFREIFLVTSMKGGATVKVPLKLNLLLEDFEVFTKVLTRSKRYQDQKWKHQYFLWLAKCLLHFGYKHARIAAKKPGVSIVLGCWEVGLWDGSKRVADYICTPHEMPHSELITDEIDEFIEGEDKDIGEFLEERKKLTCCFPFYFPLDDDAKKQMERGA